MREAFTSLDRGQTAPRGQDVRQEGDPVRRLVIGGSLDAEHVVERGEDVHVA